VPRDTVRVMAGSRSLVDGLTAIVGPQHVLTDPALTAGYVTDWTGRWHGWSTAVVRPGSTAEVAEVVRACVAAGVAIVPQGGNTGLVGASVPHHGEVVVSLRRLDTVEKADPLEHTLAAGSGVTLAAAQSAAASVGLQLGVDLAARDSATLGGMVATNAGGLRVVRYGTTRDQVLGLEAVLADGTVLSRWGGLVKDNAGYDLVRLLVGSEGTLAILTRVLLRLVPLPQRVWVAIVAVQSLDAAHQVVSQLRLGGLALEAAEFFDASGLDLVQRQSGLRALFADSHPAYVLVEVSGTSDEELAAALAACGDLVRDAAIESAPARRLWAYRESFTEAVRAAAQGTGVPAVKLDVALPARRHPRFETALRGLINDLEPGAMVVSFGHLVEGNSHVNLIGIQPERVDEVTEAALRLVVDHGGSISAEHGIGQAKRRWLALQRGPADIEAMRAIKNALDPRGVLSPGTLLP
jgi:FAD/FMN-containing dehydrogenase